MRKKSAPAVDAAWEQRWRDGHTGWDLGEPHPLMVPLLQYAKDEGGLAAGGRVLVPGCGRGHEAAFMSRAGYQTYAVDIAPTAVAAAKSTYGHLSDFEVIQGDLLAGIEALPTGLIGQLNAAVDRAMLCALPPSQRRSYVATCAQGLVSGGLFMGILFAEVGIQADEGPPFAIDEQELHELFSDDFTLVCLERLPAERPALIKQEWLCIWMRH